MEFQRYPIKQKIKLFSSESISMGKTQECET